MTYHTSIALILTVSLMAGVGSFVATVWARGEPAPAVDAHPVGWLGLSDQQHQTIHGADPTFDQQAKELSTALRQSRTRLAELLEARDVDDEQVLEEVEHVIAAHNALERRVARHVLTIRTHLTVEQQKRLMGLCARHVRGQVRQHGGGRGADADEPHMSPMGRGPSLDRGGLGTSGGPDAHRLTIHQLIDQHKKIKRTVNDIDGGIEASTTSDDPAIAEMIQQHVRDMQYRLEQGQSIRAFDPVFQQIFIHHDQIKLSVEVIEGGVRVVETSDDPQVVMLIRQHATKAVTEFVELGAARVPDPTPLPEGYRQAED